MSDAQPNPAATADPNAGFQYKISIDELRKRKLMVATPMYGGKCDGIYTRSMIDLSALCAANGIELQVYYMFNESLIARARNYCADAFIRSTATHLMFIDGDIGFSAQDVISLLAMSSEDQPYDVVGGPYAKKCISWEKIKAAVNKGFADENPNNLENFVGDYVFSPIPGTTSIQLNQPAEVMEIGTGFMMIRKSTFIKLYERFPDLMYRPDHVRSSDFDGSREIGAGFQDPIIPHGRHLSEDYFFCQKVREAGMKVWICPWMSMKHAGTYIFGGSLMHLSQIKANASVGDEIHDIKKKEKHPHNQVVIPPSTKVTVNKQPKPGTVNRVVRKK